MALTPRNPNTILLTGKDTAIIYADRVAVEAITPGMLVEVHDDGGVPAWGVHDVADDPCPRAVALDLTVANLGIADAYADGDIMHVAYLAPGSVFYGIIPSGQDINIGDRLQSNGDGKLKAAASGDASFVSLTDTGSVSADTRLRVEVIR